MFDWTHLERRAAAWTSGLGWAYLVPGGTLVLLGLLILLVPNLLEVLVATALLVSGASLLAFGWRLRRAARHQGPTWHEGRDPWLY